MMLSLTLNTSYPIAILLKYYFEPVPPNIQVRNSPKLFSKFKYQFLKKYVHDL